MGLARDLTMGTSRQRGRTPSMRPVYARLHALALSPRTTVEQLTEALQAADAQPDRRRLAEGGAYTAALRRYQHDTGQEYARG